MSRALLNALFALLAVISVTSICYADSTLSPADEPAAVDRHCGCEEAQPTCAPAHAEIVALPPPLTIAYKDPCHPCCANCMTYSNLHVDNEGDNCCKPAAVIKTHHFVKEINYKCCTGPCGDVTCEPCCTKIACNPEGNRGAVSVWPDGARYCHDCCEPCCHHHDNCCHREPCCHHEPCCEHREPCCCHHKPCCEHHEPCCCHHEPCCERHEPCCCHHDNCGHEICCHEEECGRHEPCCCHHEPCCGHHEPCCGHHELYCCEGGYHGRRRYDDDYENDDGYNGRHYGNRHGDDRCCCEHNTCCEKCIITHAIADNCGTHYCVTSCVKDPCGNRCVETHHCYAPNPSPCACKDNLSTECCITHFIVEPPCGCGCGCPQPMCTPSFQGSHAPELPPAPSTAPQCPTVPDKAPACPACPDSHAYQHPQPAAPY
ncbi:hypothetical protein IW138_002764 [Coemansia sp. RSA 986]|nr:hypothetical protein IW138_002764 [Coemansia sp. RSA 986]